MVIQILFPCLPVNSYAMSPRYAKVTNIPVITVNLQGLIIPVYFINNFSASGLSAPLHHQFEMYGIHFNHLSGVDPLADSKAVIPVFGGNDLCGVVFLGQGDIAEPGGHGERFNVGEVGRKGCCKGLFMAANKKSICTMRCKCFCDIVDRP